MKRRDFLKAASGAAAASAAAGAAEATAGSAESGRQTTTTAGGNQSGNGSGNTTAGGNQSGNQSGGGAAPPTTKTVEVGPNNQLVFKPETVYVTPGSTVRWVWKSNNHNVVPGEIPQGSSWEGTPGPPSQTYNEGYTYEHTFETKGAYPYWCEPHKSAGMTGEVVVNDTGQAPQTGGSAEMNPEEMGVPFQAHFVGLATIVMVVVSLVYTFFVLKYGESDHASAPNKE